MLTKLYALFGTGILATYLVVSISGKEFDSPKQELLPPSVRSSPGGYRSFHFWHSGFHGGK